MRRAGCGVEDEVVVEWFDLGGGVVQGAGVGAAEVGVGEVGELRTNGVEGVEGTETGRAPG